MIRRAGYFLEYHLATTLIKRGNFLLTNSKPTTMPTLIYATLKVLLSAYYIKTVL